MKSSLLVALLLLAACSGVPGSGTAKTEVREVPAFDALSVSGSTHVDLRRGEPRSVKITADDNLLEHLETRVEGSKLVVRPTRSIRPKTQIRLEVVTPALKALESSGSVKATLTDLRGEALRVELSGSGQIEATGAVKRFAVDISGSGVVRAEGLVARQVDIGVSGSGDARVHAEANLKVRVSGSGKVRYRGTPEVERAVSGSGSVEPL